MFFFFSFFHSFFGSGHLVLGKSVKHSLVRNVQVSLCCRLQEKKNSQHWNDFLKKITPNNITMWVYNKKAPFSLSLKGLNCVLTSGLGYIQVRVCQQFFKPLSGSTCSLPVKFWLSMMMIKDVRSACVVQSINILLCGWLRYYSCYLLYKMVSSLWFRLKNQHFMRSRWS